MMNGSLWANSRAIDDVNRRVALADESRAGRRKRDDLREAACPAIGLRAVSAFDMFDLHRQRFHAFAARA